MISVRDLGEPPNVINKVLEICVTDFNDHPPVFISPPNNITIRIPEVSAIMFF